MRTILPPTTTAVLISDTVMTRTTRVTMTVSPRLSRVAPVASILTLPVACMDLFTWWLESSMHVLILCECGSAGNRIRQSQHRWGCRTWKYWACCACRLEF